LTEKGKYLKLFKKSENDENWENIKNLIDLKSCCFIIADFEFDKDG
jgi:hypothetical protein